MVVPPGGADFGMGPGVPTFWQSPRECPQGTLTASRGSSQLSTQMPGALCMYLRGQLTPSLDPLTLVSLRPRDTHCSSSSRTRGGRQNGGGGTRTETQPALSLLVVEARPAGSLSGSQGSPHTVERVGKAVLGAQKLSLGDAWTLSNHIDSCGKKTPIFIWGSTLWTWSVSSPTSFFFKQVAAGLRVSVGKHHNPARAQQHCIYFWR